MKVLDFCRTAVSYVLVIPAIVVVFPACILTKMFPQWKPVGVARFFYWIILKASLLPIEFEGLENLPRDSREQFIFAANHQSSFDIPLIGTLLRGGSHLWLFKDALLKIPVFGSLLQRVGAPVDFGSVHRRAASFRRIVTQAREQKASVILFPEGRRGFSNDILPFRRGFALAATMLSRPVLPIRIVNAYKAYPMGSFLLNYFPIKVIIGKPISCVSDESVSEFSDRVRQWFVEQEICN